MMEDVGMQDVHFNEVNKHKHGVDPVFPIGETAGPALRMFSHSYPSRIIRKSSYLCPQQSAAYSSRNGGDFDMGLGLCLNETSWLIDRWKLQSQTSC